MISSRCLLQEPVWVSVRPLVPQAGPVPSKDDSGGEKDALRARGTPRLEGQAGLNRQPHKGAHTWEA